MLSLKQINQQLSAIRIWLPLLVFSAVALYGLFILALGQWIILPGFAELDRESAQRNFSRSQSAIQRELHHLSLLVKDWGAWDDSYRFVQDRNQAYIDASLNLETLQSARLDGVFYYNDQGALVWGKKVDGEEKLAQDKLFLPNPLPKEHWLNTTITKQQAVSGLYLFEEQIYLFSAYPILTSRQQGPTRGSLVMVRQLSDTLLQTLAQQTEVDFQIHLWHTLHPSSPYYLFKAQLQKSSQPIMVEKPDNRLQVMGMMRDLDNRPVLIISSQTKMRGRDRGAQSMILLSICTLIVGVVIALFISRRLNQRVIQPLTRLTHETRNMEVMTDPIHIPQLRDEIGLLARTFATLLERLRENHRELEMREIKMRSLSESARMGILIMDGQGAIQSANPACESLFGLPNDQMVGQPFVRFLPNITLVNATTTIMECTANRADGTSFPAELSLSDFLVESGLHFTGIIQDITPRKQAESALKQAHQDLEQRMKERSNELTLRRTIEVQLKESIRQAEAANRSKSDFVANMSHEIRTPMNAVIGLSHLALRSAVDPNQADYLQKIHDAGQSLLHIINDILDFSKIEAGKLELEQIPFNLDETLSSLAALVAIRAEEKGLELIINRHQQIPATLISDPYRLNQILLNLIGNAIKFTDRGEVILSVTPLEQEGHLQFAVEDTGPGLSSDQASRLFTPFNQADSSTTRRFGGTGLGLTICKRLVELMGGTIGLESQVGVGSCFRFSIQTTPQESPSIPAIPPPLLQNVHALVSMKNPKAQEALLTTLTAQRLQAQAVERTDLSQKIQVLQPQSVLILEADPIQQEQIEAWDQQENPLPTLLICTHTDHPKQVDWCQPRSWATLLKKPIIPSELLGALTALLHPNLPESPKAQPQEEVPNLQGIHVLLVEDNALNRQVATELLQMAKVRVSVAINGIQAVEKGPSLKPDLILMDIQMPEMDGMEATRRLREKIPPETPIIAMTANAMTGDRDLSLQAGMNDHIPKPIDPKVLYATLSRWTGRKGPAQPLFTAPSPTPTPIPDLPGIDVTLGLSRMGGNRPFYQKVLKNFQADQSQAIQVLHAHLESGDRASALRHMHTLKGLAGSIGATQLQTLAAQVEAQLATSDPSDLSPLLPPLEAEWQRVMAGLDTLATPVAAEKERKPLDYNAFKDSLEQLENHLTHRRPRESRDTLEQLLNIALPSVLASKRDELALHVKKYRFKNAMKSLEALMASLDEQ
ncbi:MAG: response regulator [Magnetococcales bacterium]|nr:response regulator [Magnetococcales bacterium]